ncbi:MAG: hypothetical protein EXS35_08815 [Pedosphaera sp.]|nr:hypothetical protein [Pedosphaera sp.]
MKFAFRFIVGWLFVAVVSSAPAAFTSLYVFGDGVCTTTNGPGGSDYYGDRYSNGRVWIEVLAQRQGLTYESNKNWSFFGHFSPNLVENVTAFTPTNASTALFVVWVCNADFVENLTKPEFAPYASNNLAIWTDAINLTLSNHVVAVQTLYAKGARTLIVPNAVDITKAPFYNLDLASEAFIRQRVIDFNLAFTNRMNLLRTSLTNLTIIIPDMFALLEDITTHPATFGLTNVTSYAIFDFATPVFTGPATNYLFWDYLHPGAKVHEVLADSVQHQLSPARVNELVSLGSNVQLTVANMPLGLNGFVDASTNLLTWTQVQNFSSTNLTQNLTAPASGPLRFYRLRFPFAWSWP